MRPAGMVQAGRTDREKTHQRSHMKSIQLLVRACLKILSDAVFRWDQLIMNGYASDGKHGFWWQTTTAKWFWRAKTLPPSLKLRRDKPGGVAFGFGLRGRGRHSPLRGCSARSASPKAKIHSRSITHNFQTGSKGKNPRHGMLESHEHGTTGWMNI